MSGTGIEFVPNLTGVFDTGIAAVPNLTEDYARILTEQIPLVYLGTASIPFRTHPWKFPNKERG